MGKSTPNLSTPHAQSIVIVLAHGWAWQSHWFKPLLSELVTATANHFKHIQFYTLEQNYYSPQPAEILHYQKNTLVTTSHPCTQSLQFQHPNAHWVGIGHSLGFSHILNFPVQWDGLISLHGFTQFAANKNNPNGISPRLINTMIKKFAVAPAEVITDFLHHCKIPSPKIDYFCPKKLHDHLNLLLTLNANDKLNNYLSCNTPLATIASTCDSVIPKELTHCKQSLKHTLQTPHAGPCTQPKLYTKAVIELLKNLRHRSE